MHGSLAASARPREPGTAVTVAGLTTVVLVGFKFNSEFSCHQVAMPVPASPGRQCPAVAASEGQPAVTEERPGLTAGFEFESVSLVPVPTY